MIACRFLLRTNQVSTVTQRGLASISIEHFGTPSNVLKYDANPVKSSPKADEVSVKVNVAPVTIEDSRMIRGISLINHSRGVVGRIAVGKISGSNNLVLVNDSPSWADTITASSSSCFPLDGCPSAEEGAAVPSFLSAWAILKRINNLQSGDSIVITDGETAVGQALVQLGKVKNISVIPVTPKEVESKEFAATLKSKQGGDKIKGAVSGSSGKHLHSLLKVIPTGGELVVYHGLHQSLETVAGVDVPIARAIFQDVRISGFDYLSWFRNSSNEYKTAFNEVLALVKDKKLSLKPTVLSAAEANKAVLETEKTGKLYALHF